MNIGRRLERLMAMDDATWERHSNPWSGWTRMPILPLLYLAIWSRIWLGWGALVPIAILVVWVWINPRLFGPPKTNDAWMTKAVLGERVWLAKSEVPIARHHVWMGRLLNCFAGFGLLASIYGLWHFELGWVCAGAVCTVGAKMWFLDRMVWLLQDTAERGNS